MKELDTINGIQADLVTANIGEVYIGRAYYNDVNDLPVIAIAPNDTDVVNNPVGGHGTSEFNITSSFIIEAHVEADRESIDTVFNMWREITKVVFAYTPAVVSDKVTINYTGKTVTYPDDSADIAVLQVSFDVQYIENLGV